MFKESSALFEKPKRVERTKKEEEIIKPGSAEDLENEINREIEGKDSDVRISANKKILSNFGKEEPEKIETESENLKDVEKNVRKTVEAELKAAGIKLVDEDGSRLERIVAHRVAVEMERQRVEKLSAADLEKENEELKERRNKLLALIEQRKTKEELRNLENLYFNDSPDQFAFKTMILPSFIRWTKKREASGKDVNILEYIKEEDISKVEFDILIEEFRKYDRKEKPVTLSKDAMLEKIELCDILRKEAHQALAEIGNIDPYIKDLKMQKWEAEFNQWFSRFFERAEVTMSLWREGLMPLNWAFVKFWDGQGRIEKLMAWVNKKRMGEIEHTFMLKGISKKIESIVELMDKSDNAKEIQFYNNELKNCLSFFVEWNNEFRRLHKVGKGPAYSNGNIGSIYEEISKKTKKIDRLMIEEIYKGTEIEKEKDDPEKDKNSEKKLTSEQDNEKKRICSYVLNEINRNSSELGATKSRLERYKRWTAAFSTTHETYLWIDNQSVWKKDVEKYNEADKPLDENKKAQWEKVINILIKIDETKNVNELSNLVNEGKKVVFENSLRSPEIDFDKITEIYS